MSQEMQRRILRGTIVLALTFGLIFGVLRQMTNASERYVATTTLVVLPREEDAFEIFSSIDADATATFVSEAFFHAVSDARYRETEEWKTFFLDVTHPARGVFVFVYRADAGDPFLALEAISTVRREAFSALSQKYDVSRDVEIRFMDAGEVSETHVSQGGILYALLGAIGVTLVGEGMAFWLTARVAGRELRHAVRKKVRSTSSSVRPWWLAPVSMNASLEHPVFAVPIEKDEEAKKTISLERQRPVLSGDTSESEREVAKVKTEISAHFQPSVVERQSFPNTGSAPDNLMLLTEIPEILRPTWAIRHEREIAANASRALASESVGVSAKTEQKEAVADESLFDESLMTDEMAFESPAKNPEPSAQELKERLNRLLRGEIG